MKNSSSIALIFTLFLASIMTIVGRATNSKLILPDGGVGYSIECDGWAVPMNACFEKAGDKCPNDYDIQSESHPNGAAVQKGLLIKCKRFFCVISPSPFNIKVSESIL